MALALTTSTRVSCSTGAPPPAQLITLGTGQHPGIHCLRAHVLATRVLWACVTSEPLEATFDSELQGGCWSEGQARNRSGVGDTSVHYAIELSTPNSKCPFTQLTSGAIGHSLTNCVPPNASLSGCPAREALFYFLQGVQSEGKLSVGSLDLSG